MVMISLNFFHFKGGTKVQDVIIYKQKDMVLEVDKYYDPISFDLDSWRPFIERLIEGRLYQRDAIINSIIFLASNKYGSINDLIDENYKKNIELQKKYTSIREYFKNLQMPNKLYANIDLATGTGKSYVIYGIAQIMLGLGVVDKVIVLCPSLTIEAALIEKFQNLSSDAVLKSLIPVNAVYRNPSIIDANVTIKSGDICIENIHAVYSNTGSSIEDSLKESGEKVLVLNDESHHIFNKISGNSAEDNDLKKWKEFLLNKDYNFKYMLGFTGTAYIENDYFNDVIYRYSLRDAIEDKVVKNIEYVQKDESVGEEDEKFQKIYQNHIFNINNYPKIKPLTILVTKDIAKAKDLYNRLVDYLEKAENFSRDIIEKKVLIVTSNKEHKPNIRLLKQVDDKNSPIQWIISVSMLTEGWDVKNVFQIVPWEDRAFNSKLLIAQVLGRGLRVPSEYISPQPRVTVFNHDSWSRNIKNLVNEVLEIETRISCSVLESGERSNYNFSVYNLDYSRVENEIENNKATDVFDYSRIEKEGIKLDSQVDVIEKGTIFETVNGKNTREQNYRIEYKTWSVDEILDKIYDEFEIRDWEGRILQLGKHEYTQNNLPPRETIKDIIIKSMRNVGINGDKVIERNVIKILQAFSTLLRKKSKTVVQNLKINDPFEIKTSSIIKSSTGIGNLRRGYSVFYSNDWEDEIESEEQRLIISELIEDESLPRSAIKLVNKHLMKTPLNLVIASLEPERKFVEYICKKDVAIQINSWIKSRDKGFYEIEYSLKYGGKDSKTRKYAHNTFNPDFFIKIIRDEIEYILVVETKADKDVSNENKAKYKFAKEHFDKLNNKLNELGIKQKYIFHFLSPNGYSEYFEYLKSGILLEDQSKFRCELENLLEELE